MCVRFPLLAARCRQLAQQAAEMQRKGSMAEGYLAWCPEVANAFEALC